METMNSGKKVLAFDFGASSGRAMLGTFQEEAIHLQEIHRFSNDPVIVNGTMYWDVLRLLFEIKQSLLKAKQYGKIDSIGIDTWGVDFGLLDKDGMLLENPIHYRDLRTAGMLEKSFEKIDKAEFYNITGNQFMEINTAFQLLSLKEKRECMLERADTMLLMPDLFNYLLSFLKNIIGLWLIQESRRQWIREGKEYSFSDLEMIAQASMPLQCFINPDDPVFLTEGNMPRRIKEYCLKTGQYVPKTEAEIVRCINESLALKYRYSLEQIIECTNKEYRTIYMVGGGIQSRLLYQMTANACGCNVSAGPVEATVLGNIAVQLIAKGEIKDLKEARRIIRNSQEVSYYSPEDTASWDKAYKRFEEVMGC